jgi:hypothetical protein
MDMPRQQPATALSDFLPETAGTFNMRIAGENAWSTRFQALAGCLESGETKTGFDPAGQI